MNSKSILSGCFVPCFFWKKSKIMTLFRNWKVNCGVFLVLSLFGAEYQILYFKNVSTLLFSPLCPFQMWYFFLLLFYLILEKTHRSIFGTSRNKGTSVAIVGSSTISQQTQEEACLSVRWGICTHTMVWAVQPAKTWKSASTPLGHCLKTPGKHWLRQIHRWESPCRSPGCLRRDLNTPNTLLEKKGSNNLEALAKRTFASTTTLPGQQSMGLSSQQGLLLGKGREVGAQHSSCAGHY